MTRQTEPPGHRAPSLEQFSSALARAWIAEDPDERTRVEPGTLGFFDISGFTRLSERLARGGKVGAESITEIVDAVFEPMIEQVLTHGGDVLQFSGDAILVFFPGWDSAPRAGAAALAMQRTLDEVGRIATDRGTVRLRMSVGMHLGPIAFARIGDLQQTVFAFGPEATRTCLMEKAANAGEVLVTAELAARLEPGVVRRRPDGAFLLRHAMWDETPTRVADGSRAASVDASIFVARPLREVLGTEVPGEHRPVALGFVGVRDLDSLIAAVGLDEVAARLHEIAREIELVQDAYEVTFIGVNTSATACELFLSAGTPVVHEDDEDRMLLALLHILSAGIDLPLAAGANRGRTFTAVIGHPTRRVYSVNGDSTNLAARVTAHAELGQVLATATMLDHTRRTFRTTPVAPFAAKGKRALVEASEVREPDGEESSTTSSGTAFVGRDDELSLLVDALADAHQANGRVVEVIAEPGMGKSALVAELQRAADGTTILVTSADPYAQSRPYYTWRGLLRGIAGIPLDASRESAGVRLTEWVGKRVPRLASWLPLIAMTVDATVAPTPEVERLDARYVQDRLQIVIGDLLGALLDAPTLFVVEDTHWLDQASRELLTHVALRAPQQPWLVVFTHRPDGGELDLPNVQTMQLGPLTVDSAETLAVATAGDAPLERTKLARLVAQAGGNPLFVRELVAVAGSDGALPESVERVIGSRIDALPPAFRTLLREAAVMGARADIAVLAAALDQPAIGVPRAWVPLVAFLEEEAGTVRFRHDLFRFVAYEGLPFHRRRDLHGRIGDELARTVATDGAEEAAPALALHFSLARRYADAWTWGTTAAEHARAQAALVDALELYAQALEAAGHLPELDPEMVATVAETMGDVGERAGRLEDSHSGYRMARRLLADDAVAKGRLLRKEGYIAEKAGDYVGSLRWYRRAMTALELVDDSDGERVHAALGYAATRIHQGKLVDARRWIEDALPEARNRGDTEALAQAYLLLEIAAAESGDPHRMEYEEIALALAREVADERRLASLLLNLGLSAANESRWHDAAAHYAEAEGHFRSVGHVVGSALVANNRAELLTDQGRYEEARPLLEDSRRAFRAARYEVGVAIATSGLSRLDVRAGRYAEAHQGLDDAEARFRHMRAGLYVADTLVRQVECLVSERRPEAALETAAVAAEELARLGHPAVLPITLARITAFARAQLGQTAEATAEIERALALARDDAVAFEIAACLDAAATIRGDDRSLPNRERDVITRQLGVVALPTFRCERDTLARAVRARDLP